MFSISRCWHLGGLQLVLTSCLTISGASACFGDGALAQLTPDTTLGAESSVVTPLNPQVDRIDGGAIRGANLFHSFQEFNINEGRGAYFTSLAGIKNILTRVTGTNASNILGTLGVTGGNANLFLINPNGIIFGQNARLDVGGSFVATTANTIGLANGDIFSANPSSPLPAGLLNVNPNAFFFNQIAAQPIINRSTADSRGLEVPQSQSLLLVGGNVYLEGGQILASGGRVELGGLAGSGSVGLNVDANNLSLNIPNDVVRTDVSLTDGARVQVAAPTGGGTITVNARNLNIRESLIGVDLISGFQAGDITLSATGAVTVEQSSRIQNVEKSGDINIKAESLFLTDSFLSTRSIEGGAGDILIQASGDINFVDSSISSIAVREDTGTISVIAGGRASILDSRISTNTIGGRSSGNIVVQAVDRVSVSDTSLIETSAVSEEGTSGSVSILSISGDIFFEDSFISTRTNSSGIAGNILMQADGNIDFVDSDISSSTRNEGNAGNILMQANGSINSVDSSILSITSGLGNAGDILVQADGNINFVNNSIFSVTSGFGTSFEGNAGNISVQASGDISFVENLIFSSTFTRGNAGNVSVQADGNINFLGDSVFSGSGVRGGNVEPNAERGDGGDIYIQARSLSVTDGADISALTTASGKAGNIQVETTDFFTLSDSELSTRTEGIGDAGVITINTPQLLLQEGAQVSASTSNSGQGGSITVSVDILQLNESKISASTVDGQAGSVSVNAVESVELIGAGGLSVEANDGGTAGDLTVVTERMNVSQGARLTVSSPEGQAGNLTISADSLFLNQGQLSAVTGMSGTLEGGANINLQNLDLLVLGNESLISASALAEANGGNIIINAQDGFVVGIPSENSDIVGNADRGNGGNINITTQGIYGLEYRPKLTPLSDINASSQFGVDGTIQINTLGIDPSRGLVNLPTQPVETEVAQGCQMRPGENQSQFIVTGRGGLPPNPKEPLSTDAVQVGWVTLNSAREHRSSTTTARPESIVEAQGWVMNEKGEVVLTASAPATISPSSWHKSTSCGA